MSKNKHYKLNYLSQDFYKTYDRDSCPEILSKDSRPYMIVLTKIKNNTFAIPFRSHIKHNNCYKFKRPGVNPNMKGGLDFSKAVIINDKKYLEEKAFIEKKEYTDIDTHFYFITSKLQKYVEGYCTYVKGEGSEKDNFKYKFTSLKHFHKELGLEKHHPKLDKQLKDAKKIAQLQHRSNHKKNPKAYNKDGSSQNIAI